MTPSQDRAVADPSCHIVFGPGFDGDAVTRARSLGQVTVLRESDEATLALAVRACDALVVRSGTRVSRHVLEHADRLRVIGRAGVGLENIDLDAAGERGITVVYTPAAATEAVADLTVGLMLCLLRGIATGDAMVRGSRFAEGRARYVGRELGQLSVGLVGLGRIGKATARRCAHGFGTSILYDDLVDPGPLGFSATRVDKELLYGTADIVSLHVPLTDLTHGMIDEPALAKFKRGSILINTARGAVVDGVALAGALTGGVLSGAALDVFDPEPLPDGHPLLAVPNTVLTPHIGARTVDGLAGMNAVVDDVARVLRGEPPHYPAPM